MANSVFVGSFGIQNNGTDIIFSLPGAFPDGTAAAPGVAFASELGSGLTRLGAGDVSLSVLGVSRFEATSTTTSIKAPDGGSYFIQSNGKNQINSSLLTMGSGGTDKWSWSAATASDGVLSFTNGSGATGAGFDITTDAVLKLRTRAQSAYATLDCLGLKASGAAGASGTGTVISAITVVNGIITAITVA